MMCLSDNSFRVLRAILRDQLAHNLTADKAYLAEARLQRLAHRYTCGDINALIEKASASSIELRTELVEAMAIHETFFFRDPLLSETIINTMIPALISKRKEKTLRIWSAACSTGQEPYSVAMILEHHFPELKDWDIKIVASDFSGRALSKAEEGCYCLNEVNRGLPAKAMTLYFDQEGLDWKIKPDIRNMVDFKQINLARTWPELPVFDIVLLRNVLIYFSDDARQTLLNRVKQVTQPDGYLLLGASEALDKGTGFAPALPGSHKPFYIPN